MASLKMPLYIRWTAAELSAYVTALYVVCVRKSASSAAAKRAAWDQTAGGVLLTGFLFYIITSTLVSPTVPCLKTFFVKTMSPMAWSMRERVMFARFYPTHKVLVTISWCLYYPSAT